MVEQAFSLYEGSVQQLKSSRRQWMMPLNEGRFVIDINMWPATRVLILVYPSPDISTSPR